MGSAPFVRRRSGEKSEIKQPPAALCWWAKKKYMFYPVAIETAGTWDVMAIELVQEIGRRTTVIAQDTRETVFLFQRLSIALQQGNAVSFPRTRLSC